MFRLERWKAGTLLATWIAYWLALLGVTIGPGLLAAWRLARLPGSHGTMSMSVDGGRVLLDVHDKAASTPWVFSTSVTAALLWIALPPLALWVVWLVSRPRRPALTTSDELFLSPPALAEPTAERPTAERVERRDRPVAP